jgi:anti-sigma regulatory factor (Ser/Thr protein kinase)
MEPLLIDEWLGQGDRISMLDEASVALVRERVREIGAAQRLPDARAAALVSAASELGHNQLRHARAGEVVVRAIERDGVAGVEVVAADLGDGLLDPSAALKGEPRVPTSAQDRPSLGVGLPAALELADETDFDVRVGSGTCVWARKFAGEFRRRRQVGIYGRPCPGELISGDHAAFVRSETDLLVALADGLGHGPAAWDAAAPGLSAVRAVSDQALDRILEHAHAALAGTRGAVMALARLPEPGEAVQTASVGNVSVQVYGTQKSWGNAGTSFVLGTPGQMRKPIQVDHAIEPRDVLVLFSDGVTIRVDLEPDLLFEHPVVIAHQLVQRFGRNNDDALVLVAR